MQLRLTVALKKIFVLTQGKLLYSALFSLAIFIFQFLPYIYHSIEGNEANTRGYLGTYTSEIISQKLHELSQRPYSDVATVILLYCFVGVAVLAIFIGLRNTFVVTRNEISQKFGKSSNKLTFFIFARKIVRYMLFLCFIVLSVVYLLGYWLDLMSIFVYTGMDISDVGYMIAGYVGLTLNIYVVWVIIHLIWFHQKTDKTL